MVTTLGPEGPRVVQDAGTFSIQGLGTPTRHNQRADICT